MRSSSAGFAPAFTSLVLGATVALTVAACGTIAPGTGAPHGTTSSHTAAPPGTPAPTPTASASTAPATGTWQLLWRAPRTAALILPVSVWTGRQMLIYGIAATRNLNNHRGITLGYAPATGQWRRLAPGPAPMMAQNGQIAVWTGTEMLVFGLTNAAYNPVTNTWRPIARYAGPVGAVSVWTGHRVIVWGGQFEGKLTTTFAHDGAAYQPPTR